MNETFAHHLDENGRIEIWHWRILDVGVGADEGGDFLMQNFDVREGRLFVEQEVENAAKRPDL